MNLDLLYALTAATAPIVVKNVGVAVADTLSAGIPSALKKSVEEIKEKADQSNNNLFYWQVETFLNTTSAEISYEEVTAFLEKHPEGYRLGAEIFKILESTYITKQAELISIAFKQRVYGNISDQDFHKYIHIISQLNHHIIKILEDDLMMVRDRSMHKLPREDNHTSRMGFLQYGVANSRMNGYLGHSLEILGFIIEDVDARNREDSAFSNEKTYKRTSLYLDFYLDIYKNQIPAI